MDDLFCQQCRERHASVRYESVDGEQQELCSRCYNILIAEGCGLDFEHADFDPVELIDARNNKHTFHFETFHYVSGVSLKAFEMRDARCEAPGL